MKSRCNPIQFWLCVAVLTVAFTGQSQTSAPIVPLKLQSGTNGINLIVGNLSQTGALFLQTAPDLWSLSTNATSLLQTNTQTTNGLQLQVASPGILPNQAFFSAIFFPGQSLDDFGDPENDDSDASATMLLYTSGMPDSLTNGLPFSVAFLVADPTGQPLSLSGTVTFLVVSSADGSLHPDAVVNPQTGQMTNGFLEIQLTVNAKTSLNGYTLILNVSTDSNAQGGVRPLNLKSSFFLTNGFDVGPGPVYFSGQQMTSALSLLRTTYADLLPNSWNPPLTSYSKVSGSFGEWRGDTNISYHHGLDLPAPIISTVYASRSGIVAGTNNIPGVGFYVNVDHGDGWFSRYLHLDGAHILVRPGQPVVRGTPLANQLYAAAGWHPHLHFEVRFDKTNTAHWGPGQPGIGQDPVLTTGIFPIPKANNFPQIDIFGIAIQPPWETIFTKIINSASGSSPAYIFVKTSDHENGNNVGPRSVSFLPEGSTVPQMITPSNDVAITSYLPSPSSGNSSSHGDEGFALYDLLPNDKADSNDYFRYWFLWDTSPYAGSPTGARSFTLSVQGYSGLTTNYVLTFGPQNLGGITQTDPNEYQFTNVAYLGTNYLVDPSKPDQIFSQPDQYKLEIIQTDGQLISGVSWTENGTNLRSNYTKVFDVHTNQALYSFILPEGTSPTGLAVRVSSRLAPDIAWQQTFEGLLIMARTGMNGLTAIGPNVAVNHEGVIAFTGNNAAGSQAFALSEPFIVTPLGLIGSNRSYLGVGVSGGPDPQVLARELVSGPVYIVREWDVATGVGTILGSSVTTAQPADFDSATSFLDINSNGVAAVSALISGSTTTALLIGGTRPLSLSHSLRRSKIGSQR